MALDFVGGSSQSERNLHISFRQSLPVDVVFQSWSHMGAKEAAVTKADSKVLHLRDQIRIAIQLQFFIAQLDFKLPLVTWQIV